MLAVLALLEGCGGCVDDLVAECGEQVGGVTHRGRAGRVDRAAGSRHRPDADAEPARLRPRFVCERPRRRRGGVGIPGLVAGQHVQQRSRIAHRPRHDPVGRGPAPTFAGLRPTGDASAGRLQPEQAVARGRDADRSAPVGCVRDRNHPGGDGGCRPSRRPTRGAIVVPRVAGRTVGERLGRGRRGELGRVGPAEDHEPGPSQAGDDVVLDRWSVVRVAKEGRPEVAGLAGHLRVEVLEQDRNATEGSVRKGAIGLVAGCGEPFVDDCVDRRVGRLDAGDGSLDQLPRRRLAVADPSGQLHGVVGNGDVGRSGTREVGHVTAG